MSNIGLGTIYDSSFDNLTFFTFTQLSNIVVLYLPFFGLQKIATTDFRVAFLIFMVKVWLYISGYNPTITKAGSVFVCQLNSSLGMKSWHKI